MSSSMYWRPAPKEVPPPNELSYELKKAVARRWWDHDGSLNGGEIEIGRGHLNYLQVLADGGVEGADDLIKAVEEHGNVLVWISN